MDPARPSPLRIYRAGPPDDPAADAHDSSAPDAHALAVRELLRPAATKTGHRELEPFSRAWFEELELKRYAAQGAWLRRVLEFSRHAGESLLMFGPGVGSDAMQYHRHGVNITVCATPADHPDLVRRNFETRGHAVNIVHAGPDLTAPFDRSTFDLAYLNVVHNPPPDLGRVVAELYRVLKPGGKVFVLAPAWYDAGFWQDVLLPFHHWYRPTVPLSDAPRHSAKGLRTLFGPFTEHRFAKRHLRRADLPYIWRFLPLWVLERFLGRVIVLRAFKPVTAALSETAVDPAA
jgi:SAM-dependent methyltransferase